MPTSPLTGVFTTAQALQAGYSPDRIRGLVRRGEWVTLRTGVHCASPLLEGARDDPAGQHAIRVAAALLAIDLRAVASEASAACLYGLPLPAGEPARAVLTVATGSATPRQYRGLLIRAAGLPDGHVTRQHGLPATTPARTVVDLARKMPFEDAVILADAALHRGLVRPADLQRMLRDCWTWPGVRRAARVVRFADGRCETPIESRSRVLFDRGGLPAPEPQQLIVDGHDNVVARVDFLWRGQRTIGESDGRIKYGDPSAIWREKRREDLLRDLGYEVVRWSWHNLIEQPERTVARIRAAFARAARIQKAPDQVAAAR